MLIFIYFRGAGRGVGGRGGRPVLTLKVRRIDKVENLGGWGGGPIVHIYLDTLSAHPHPDTSLLDLSQPILKGPLNGNPRVKT